MAITKKIVKTTSTKADKKASKADKKASKADKKVSKASKVVATELKEKDVRKAVNAILKVGIDIDTLSGHQVPVIINNRGMVIDLSKGTVTLNFKANKDFGTEVKPTKKDSKKPSKKDNGNPAFDKPTPKANKVSDVPSGCEFVRGEITKGRKTFRVNYADYKDQGVVYDHYTQVVDIKGKPFLIVNFEDGKYICRDAKGKDHAKSIKVVVEAFGGEKKPAKKTEKKPSKNFKLKLTELKQGHTEEKFNRKELKDLERKFVAAAGKLTKDGVLPTWFFKVVKHDSKRLRLIKLSSTRKVFTVVNVDTGKKSKLKLSDLLPL